ncbi:unnamed protein product [Pedinophyceae sp. YPF-701]|nr:unnamed protein product [Pedinophyceae sp. YPF-701]
MPVVAAGGARTSLLPKHGARRTARAAAPARRARTVVRAEPDEKQRKAKPEGEQTPADDLAALGEEGADFNLEDINPIQLGRRSRKAFDDIWTRFSSLGTPSRGASRMYDEQLDMMMVASEAQLDPVRTASTRVLVLGGAGRIGKVLIRKLLLRGYQVRAMVRVEDRDEADLLPRKVDLTYGDVANYEDCRRAVRGVDKVVYCKDREGILGIQADMFIVYEDGVRNVAKAILDQAATQRRRGRDDGRGGKPVVALFGSADYQEGGKYAWELEYVGLGAAASPLQRKMYRGADTAALAPVKEKATPEGKVVRRAGAGLLFGGTIYSRGGVARCGGPLKAGLDLGGTEGLVLRCGGDGQPYTFWVTTRDGHQYRQRFFASAGFHSVRLAWNFFRPASEGAPPLDPSAVVHMSITFEPRTGIAAQDGKAVVEGTENRLSFALQLGHIKAVKRAPEADFVLVSSAASALRAAATDKETADAVEREIRLRLNGEGVLRSSGLAYTVIRPGPLVEEPGGFRALVFDQGNRISQSISAADVADICLRSMHDPLARNKTFEVCYEYTPEQGLETYELVAHLPDRSNNYLSPALATLESNT